MFALSSGPCRQINSIDGYPPPLSLSLSLFVSDGKRGQVKELKEKDPEKDPTFLEAGREYVRTVFGTRWVPPSLLSVSVSLLPSSLMESLDRSKN
jgi:hypothetical protein